MRHIAKANRQTTAVVVDPNLVLELKFNTNVYTDLAGTAPASTNDYVRSWRSTVGNHLFTQSTDAARPQRQSDGLYFDGGDKISANMATEWNLGSGDSTLEFWLYESSSGGSWLAFCEPASTYAGMMVTGRTLYMSSNGSSWGVSGMSLGAYVANTWSHYAIVQQAGTVRTYKGGVQQATAAFAAGLPFNTSYPFYFGERVGSFFTGKMTDLRLYNTCKYPNGTTFTPPTRSA